MLNVPERTPPSSGQPESATSLESWLHQVIGLPHLQVKVKQRGNHLYLLCEGRVCPSQPTVMTRVAQALRETPLDRWLSPQVPVYQLILYGRGINQPRPDWSSVMSLARLDDYLNGTLDRTGQAVKTPSEATLGQGKAGHEEGGRRPAEVIPRPSGESTADETKGRSQAARSALALIDPQTLQLARQGESSAIAQCLAATLSHLGVSVRASVKTTTGDQEQLVKRLSVLCESNYSPDASLLAATIAQKLRELQLPGFRNALVFGQVAGETHPEWALRIDLTPPGEMLREWAQWGDVAAISRLLNRALATRQVKVSVILNETVLHITCESLGQSPDKVKTRSIIMALLESLAPQGIHSATIYGVKRESGRWGSSASGSAGHPAPHPSIPTTTDISTPTWVDWLTLPAAEHADQATSPLMMAKQGHLGAIAFLLTRLLNPDIKTYLATGGTRVQIRQKGDLLYIMADAPICPTQATVTKAIGRFFPPLAIQSIAGLRLYGRQAGQTRPLWSWGQDLRPRQRDERRVAEATPEFAASDAYVGDLLVAPGALVWQPDAKLVSQPELSPPPLREWLNRWIANFQQVLVGSQLFVPATSSRNLTVAEPEGLIGIGQGVKVACVWSALGLLLTLQTDWILGQMLRTQANASPPRELAVSPLATPEKPVVLPPLPLPKSNQLHKTRGAFNDSGFTQTGPMVVTPGTPSPEGVEKSLLASPLQSKAVVDGNKSPYPSFNARQLDEKLVLYRQYVAKFGPPDVLITGSSRAMRGVDPGALQAALAAQGYPGIKIFNFGVNGSTAQVENLILQRILASEPLPKMILWADGARAFNSGRLDITYNAIAVSPGYKKLPPSALGQPTAQLGAGAANGTPTLPNLSTSLLAERYQSFNRWLDQTIATGSTVYPQREQLKNLLQDKLVSVVAVPIKSAPGDLASLVPQDGKGLIDVNGFLPLDNRFNPATYYQKYARVTGKHDGDYADFRMDGAQTEALAAIAQFTQARQIPLVFVNLPLTEQYIDPDRQAHETEFQRYMLQASSEMGFTFRNLADLFSQDIDFFSDPSHLNRYGAFAVSNQLAKDPLIPWVKP
jgi:hypothetical protein